MEMIRHDFQESTWKAFELYVLVGKEAKAVAEQLDVSVNSVLLAKSRVTRRLRDEAEGLIDE